MAQDSEWFFTTPWDLTPSVRGDPLGFRPAANHFADQLAPDLSNRTVDARWITILSWCLCQMKLVPIPYTGSRKNLQELYGWLLPLEVNWIKHAIVALQGETTGRQLPGVRAIREWNRKDTDFNMSPEQLVRYRYRGPYGTYRALLRRLPELTRDGNGWEAGKTARQLAEIVEKNLNAPNLQLDRKQIKGTCPETYWSNRWPKCERHHFVPQSYLDYKPLKPLTERRILDKVLFGEDEEDENGKRRRAVAESACRGQAGRARNHQELCEHLVESLRRRKIAGFRLEMLPPFTRFADASIEVIAAVWGRLAADSCITLGSLRKDNLDAVKELTESAREYCRMRANTDDAALPRGPWDELAESVRRGGTENILQKLLEHHRCHHGGRQWMHLFRDSIYRDTPYRSDAVPYYRFRLYQICGLAVQCGVVTRLPRALADARSALGPTGEVDTDEL